MRSVTNIAMGVVWASLSVTADNTTARVLFVLAALCNLAAGIGMYRIDQDRKRRNRSFRFGDLSK